MKKMLLTIALLASHQLAIANCAGVVHWTMNITNGTASDKLHLDCHPSEDLAPGATYVYSGISGSAEAVACNGVSYSDVSCQYTDTSTNQTGTLQLVFNSCNTTTAGQSSATNPTSFACNITQPTKTGGGKTNCDYVDGYSYNSYTTDGSFVIVNTGPSYQLDWKGIVMHPVKGQAMGNKLARNLMQLGSYTSGTASYNQSTSTLTIKLTAPTTNPCS